MKKNAKIQKLLYVFDHHFCVHLTSKPLETAKYLEVFFLVSINLTSLKRKVVQSTFPVRPETHLAQHPVSNKGQ